MPRRARAPPDVYAAGDVGGAYHPVIQRHVRSEHWDNARKAGAVAARSMLGRRAATSTSASSSRSGSTADASSAA